MSKVDKQELYDLIKEKLKDDRLFVCISGASCSGKTTLARNIVKEFLSYNSVVLCQDDWFKNLYEVPKNGEGYYNMEDTQSFHIDEFVEDVMNLAIYRHCMKPTYDIMKNERIDKKEDVLSARLNIIEGLHTIASLQKLPLYVDTIYIYVDTPIEICAKRRADRDGQWVKKYSYEFLQNYYINVIFKNYEKYAIMQRDMAMDVGYVISGGLG